MKGEMMRTKQAVGWVNYDDITINLVAHTKERTADGGWQLVHGPVRPAQKFGVALSTEASTNRTEDGTVRAMELTLVGPVGALVAVDDTFTYQGLEMRVTNVRTAPDGTYAMAVHDGR